MWNWYVGIYKDFHGKNRHPVPDMILLGVLGAVAYVVGLILEFT